MSVPQSGRAAFSGDQAGGDQDRGDQAGGRRDRGRRDRGGHNVGESGSDARNRAAEVADQRSVSRASGVEAMVERQIRQALDRGLFDNLPGAGRPLRNLGGPRDENWWLRQYLLREGVSGAAFLPPALALRKEVEDLPGAVQMFTTEAQVRAAVGHLNARILDALRKPAQGPPMTVMQVDVEAIVFGWRISRIARRSSAPPGPTADRNDDAVRNRFRRRRSR